MMMIRMIAAIILLPILKMTGLITMIVLWACVHVSVEADVLGHTMGSVIHTCFIICVKM